MTELTLLLASFNHSISFAIIYDSLSERADEDSHEMNTRSVDKELVRIAKSGKLQDPRNSDPKSVVRPIPVHVIIDLAIVLADMLRVPTITPVETDGEGGLGTFKGYISAAHDVKPEILETVLDVPRHLCRDSVGIGPQVGREDSQDVVLITVVSKHPISLVTRGRECYQAVQLVCNRRCEHGHVWVVADGHRQIVVRRRVLHPNIPKAPCERLFRQQAIHNRIIKDGTTHSVQR